MQPTIRLAKNSDLPKLLTFARNTFIHTYQHLNDPKNFEHYLAHAFSESKFEQEMFDPKAYFYLLKDKEDLLGYIKLNLDKADGGLPVEACVELERIYVKNTAKGRGYGKLLIETAVTKCKMHGKSILWLGVWEKNPKAIAFYEKCGFETFGTHIFAIGNDRQTDFLMKKEI